MAITLKDMRDRAPTPLLQMAFDAALRSEPLFEYLLWDPVQQDEVAYRRARGSATTVYFSPDSTITGDADEAFDRLVAFIRPSGGHVSVPVIGASNPTVLDHIKSKTRAAVYQFMNTFVNGGFGTATLSPVMTANDGAVVGPGFDLTTRGDGGVFRLVIAGGVATATMDFKATGDVGFGLVNGAAAADLIAAGDGVYVFGSANPTRWIQLTLDVSDLTAQFAADGTYYIHLTVSSSTNSFDGILRLVTNTTSMLATPSAAAEAFDLAHLDYLLQACKTGGKKAFLGAERTQRSFLAEMRALGGVTWSEVAGKMVPTYNGIPFLTASQMPVNRTYAGVPTCAPLCLIDLEEGIRGIFRSGHGSAEYDGRSYGGMRVRNLGEIVTNAENELIRVTAHWGIEHLQLQGCVVMDGITN